MKYLHKEFEPKECLGCTSCCSIMSVEELNKPFKTDCIHQCNGCLIYPQRPQPCIDFECLFRSGVIGEEIHRPSTCGIMFSGFTDSLGDIISAWELSEGAFDTDDNQAMLEEFAKVDVLTLRHYNGKITFKGKKEALREFLLLRGQSYLTKDHG